MRANKIAAAVGATAVVAAGAVTMTTAPANAVAVNGGCAQWFVAPGTPLEGTGGAPDGYLGSPNSPWSDEATTSVIPDYTLTSNGGTVVGETRNFALVYSKGMKSFAPASGTQYWYFSVNGTQLPVVSNPLSIGTATGPGATITGAYEITAGGTNTITFEKMIYESTAGVRVVCNGQTGDTDEVNPHTTPAATNVTTSFGASAIAAASITGITNQATLNNARFGDVISFSGSGFSAAGSGTAQICTTAGVCSGTPAAFSVDASGEGSGTITVPGSMFAPGAGQKELVLTSGSEKGKAPVRIMGAPTFSTTLPLDNGTLKIGTGTQVPFSGSNWDPGQDVTVQTYTGSGQTAPPVGDPLVVEADENGNISGSYRVQAASANALNAVHSYRMPPGNTGSFVVPGNIPVAISADACTVGPQTDGHAGDHCHLLETVQLTINGGDLTMSKVPGVVQLSAVDLGEDDSASGSLQDVTVIDERGGFNGWSLTGSFAGLDGAMDIPAGALSWTPTCVPAVGNDDAVVAGGTAAFGTTALALCTVAPNSTNPSNGSTLADAALELDVPVGQAAGSYTGTLTLTLS